MKINQLLRSYKRNIKIILKKCLMMLKLININGIKTKQKKLIKNIFKFLENLNDLKYFIHNYLY